MAGAPLSLEEENYVRMSLLLTGISPRGVRGLFDSEFAPACLGISLKKETNKLIKLKAERRINQSQWNLLHPRTPDVPDSKTFDITLMITLLRNLTTMTAPLLGFEKLPAATEITPCADLARIKFYRNKLSHLEDSKIETTFFNTAWIDITGAIARLGGSLMKEECDQLKNKPLDQTSQEIKELKESLINLQQDPVPSGVRDQINNILEEWKDKDKMFVKTRAANYVLQSLKENSCVTITASSGVGKTATLQHVALQMCADGYDILLITDPDDIVKFHNPKKKTLFVIDDLCGNYSLNLTDIKIWEPVIERIKVLLNNKQTKIIVACRLQVYQDEKFDTLSVFKSCVYNLLSETMCLLKSEKQSIAEIYLEDKASQITEFYDLYDCFPLLCQLFYKNPVVDIEGFFKNPFSVLETQVEQLKTHNYLGKYCALALCVVFNNKFNEEILTEEIDEETRRIIENTCEACKLDRGTARLFLKDELDSLLFTFLKKEEHMDEETGNFTLTRETQYFYTTKHDKIFDILSHVFGQNIVYCLIKNAQSRLIGERFLLHRTNDIGQLITIVPSRYHKMYIKRMIDDWSKGKLQDVFGNINMKIPQFRLQFLYHLKKLDISYQEQLAHTFDGGDNKTLNSRKKRGVACDTVMLQCCSIGDVGMIKWCCNHGIDINLCDSDGRSPLMYACINNHREAVTMLIDKGADYNKCKNGCQSPLMIACIKGHTDLVRTLLDNGADYNKCDILSNPPLLIALKNGHTEIVRMLIENVAELHKGKKCALALCVMFNNIVHEIVLTGKIDNGTRTIIENTCEACELSRGTSRLFLMAELESLTPAFLMIEEDHVPYFFKTINDEIFGFLVFYFEQKILDSLIMNADSCLIRQRFLLERKDDMDHTITIIPSKYHQIYMQRMIDDWSKGKLYDVFNNINMKIHQFRQKFLCYLKTFNTSYQNQLVHTGDDKTFWRPSDYPMDIACDTVIQYCCCLGDVSLFHWCNSYGVNVNQCNSYGQSPVMMASLRGNTEIVKALLEKGVNYAKCDNWGNLPFMIAMRYGHTEIVRMYLDTGNWIDKSHVQMACFYGYIEIVRMLLEKGADFNKCDSSNNSPLMIAALHRHTEIVRMLIDKGADLNKCDNFNNSALMIAASCRHTEIVRMLIDKGADINQYNRDGHPLIVFASVLGNTEIVRMLLEKGVDCNQCDVLGNSIVMTATIHGHTEIVKILIDKGADCNTCNNLGQSPVMIACRNGHTETLRMLIDKGADYNKCDNLGNSPVIIACVYGHTEIVIIFLDRGHDYEKYDNFGQSPLLMACRYGHVKIVRILLNKGADYNKFDMNGTSPVMIACKNGHTETVRMLIDKGADYNTCDNSGNTPVIMACAHGHTKIVMMLLDIGGDYNICGSLGQSSLLVAIRFGQTILVKRLLENGADYNKCDNWCQSPVLMGSTFGHEEIVKMLLDIGADFDKCDIYGRSPVMLAYRHSHTSIVRMLVDIGADYKACGSNCGSPVFMACEHGHFEILKMLLDRGEDCNKCGIFGMTPLLFACKQNNTELIKMLLDKGADCDKCNEGLDSRTPLTEALDKNHTEIAMILIDNGADCNKSDYTLMTPLMRACLRGHTEIVRVLLDKGADHDKCESQGRSPVMFACQNGHTEIVKLLIDKGADCHKEGILGESTVMAACYNGHIEIVRMLLDKGVDCNKRGSDGCVPLIMASFNNYIEIVRMLIDKGADCNSDRFFVTPLINACSMGNTEIVKMLLENGADCNRRGGRGESPMMLACVQGHTEIVKLLLDKGADCNKRDLYGESPLTTASKKGHDDIVALINKHCMKNIIPDIDILYVRK